ncbi:MAG: T9SS type A sorting domain-containing protein [Bacteroidota bacterium]
MTINVNVTDVTAPIVNAILPLNQIYLNSLGSAVIPNSAVLIRATDKCSIDSVIPVSLNFTCNDLRQPLSPVLRTLTVKDKAGNSTNIAISFIVQDTIRPTATPLTRILYLGSNGTVNVSSSALVNASDNCGISTYNPPSYSFSCTSATSHQLSVTVSDLSGNSQVVTSQVVVSDTSRPVLSVVDSVNLVLGSNGLATLNIGQVDLGSTDNCGIVGRFLSKTSFDCSNLGINNVEFRALDAVGNVSFKWFVVRVIDNTPPTASALPSSPFYLNSQGFVTVNPANLIQATDNCMVDSILPTSLTFTCSDVLNPVASVQRIIRVKDRSGNVTSLTVPFTIIDTVRPIVVPVNFTAYLTANGTVSVSGTSLVSMNDNCCIATVTPSIINYTCATTYSNNVLVNVTDCNGNSQSVTSQVTIFDTIRPVVLYNDTVRLTLGSNGIATMSLSQVDLGSYDNCNIVSRTLSKTLFNCTDVGLNQVEFRLIDQSGNLSFVWVNVLVRDLTPPNATAIPNLTAYLNSQGVASLNSANLVIVSDNCQVDSILPLTQNFTCADVSNPVAPVFRQIVVKDKAGNATVVNVLISVLDTIRPTAIPLNRTIYLNSQGTATLLTSTLAHVADNCCISSYTPSTVSFNCSNVGSSANNVQFTVTDCHNNSRTVSVQVVVVDTVAPTVTTQPRTLYLNNQCQVVASSSQLVSASDACGVASYDPVYFTFGRSDCGSRDTVTITVRDFHQNERVVTVPLLVLDTIKPVVVSTPPLMDTVPYCESRVVYSMPVGSDNCGMVQVTQTAGLPSGSVFPLGLTTNRFNLTDDCGNVTEVICSIFVKNFTLPFIPNNYTFCTTDSSVLLTNGFNGYVFSGPGVISNRFYPTLAPSGVLPLNWIFTNNDGCDSSGSISIDLIEAPTIAEIVRMSPTLLRVSQPYFGYQWHRYGTPIAGATSRDLNISQAGVYSVDVMSIGGCFRMSPPIGIGVGVGIDEVVESYDMFYPNPSDGVFNLLLNSKIGANPVLEVFDALGRSVYLKGLSFEDQIDLSHLANGKYMAVVRSSNATMMQSLIIK